MCGYIIDTYSFELPYLSLVPLRGLNNIDWYSATTQVLEPAATVGRAHSHFSLTSINFFNYIDTPPSHHRNG